MRTATSKNDLLYVAMEFWGRGWDGELGQVWALQKVHDDRLAQVRRGPRDASPSSKMFID